MKENLFFLVLLHLQDEPLIWDWISIQECNELKFIDIINDPSGGNRNDRFAPWNGA